MSRPRKDRRGSGDIIVDRRRRSRWPVEVEVECNIGGVVVAGVTLNLTSDGMYVYTDSPVPTDSSVEVSFGLEGLPPKAHAKGRVVRRSKRKDDARGFAVEFDEVDPAARERIDGLSPSPQRDS